MDWFKLNDWYRYSTLDLYREEKPFLKAFVGLLVFFFFGAIIFGGSYLIWWFSK